MQATTVVDREARLGGISPSNELTQEACGLSIDDERLNLQAKLDGEMKDGEDEVYGRDPRQSDTLPLPRRVDVQ